MTISRSLIRRNISLSTRVSCLATCLGLKERKVAVEAEKLMARGRVRVPEEEEETSGESSTAKGKKRTKKKKNENTMVRE